MNALALRRRKAGKWKLLDSYTPAQAAQVLGRQRSSIEHAIKLGLLCAFHRPYWAKLDIEPRITRRELVRYGTSIGVVMRGGNLQ